MKIGFAKTGITPELPAAMGGYEARIGPARTVHRPLFSRTMAGEHEGERFAMIALDLLAVDRRLTEEAVSAASAELGLRPDHLSIWASHTHCAIDGVPDILHNGLWTANTDHVPRAYREALVRVIVSGIGAALNAMSDCRLSWRRADCPGIASNRRNREIPADSTLHLLQVVDERTDAVKGGLLHFPCHPTVIGPHGEALSSDFPGALQELQETKYPNGVFLYANGAIGDISTRYTRRSPDPQEADRMGTMLYEALQSADPMVQPTERGDEGYAAALSEFRFLDVKDKIWKRAPLQKVVLAGMTLWLVPGEAFGSYTDAVKSVQPRSLIIGLANDYIGYLPDPPAWQAGGYEVEVCRMSPGTVQELWSAFKEISIIGDYN